MLKRSMGRGVLLVVAAVACMLISGCGGKISMEKYNKVQTGMSVEQVESILGKATEQSGSNSSVKGIELSAQTMTWKDGKRGISVIFMNGQVMSKAQAGL